MNRMDFLKLMGASGVGVVAGLVSPFTMLDANASPREANYLSRHLPLLIEGMGARSSSEQPFSMQGASKVETSHLYYLPGDNHERYFFTQLIPTRNISFMNVSVPFFKEDHTYLMSLEGPCLWGVCNAIKDLQAKNPSTYSIRQLFAPIAMETNAGHSFDRSSCKATVYTTEAGKVSIGYCTNGRGEGSVTVKVTGALGLTLSEETYKMRYA